MILVKKKCLKNNLILFKIYKLEVVENMKILKI